MFYCCPFYPSDVRAPNRRSGAPAIVCQKLGLIGTCSVHSDFRPSSLKFYRGEKVRNLASIFEPSRPRCLQIKQHIRNLKHALKVSMIVRCC